MTVVLYTTKINFPRGVPRPPPEEHTYWPNILRIAINGSESSFANLMTAIQTQTRIIYAFKKEFVYQCLLAHCHKHGITTTPLVASEPRWTCIMTGIQRYRRFPDEQKFPSVIEMFEEFGSMYARTLLKSVQDDLLTRAIQVHDLGGFLHKRRC